MRKKTHIELEFLDSSSTIFFRNICSSSYSSSSPAKSCSILLLLMFFLFSSQIIFLFSKLSSPSSVLLRICIFQIVFLPSSSLKLQIVFLFLCSSSDLRFLDCLSSSFVFFISGSSSSGFCRSTSIKLESKKLKFHVDKLFHLNS